MSRARGQGLRGPLWEHVRFYVLYAYALLTVMLYAGGLLGLFTHPSLEPLLRAIPGLYAAFATLLMFLFLYGGGLFFFVAFFRRPSPSPKHLLRMLLVIALDVSAAASIHGGLAFLLSAGYIQLGAVLLAASVHYGVQATRREGLARALNTPALIMGCLMVALPYVRPPGFEALLQGCAQDGCPQLAVLDPWLGPSLLLQAWFMYLWFQSSDDGAPEVLDDPTLLR